MGPVREGVSKPDTLEILAIPKICQFMRFLLTYLRRSVRLSLHMRPTVLAKI